jgi:sugar/nucleoside kinase (ribokinase family)
VSTADTAAILSGRGPRVACVGVFIVDVLGRPVEALPRGQQSHLLDEIRITVAGTAGGTSVDLARLGADVIAVGAVGEDLLGDFLISVLAREGISTTHMVRKADVQTSATILPIHPSGDRPAWHVPGANRRLELDDMPWNALAACDALHLGGLSALGALDGEAGAEVLRHARDRGLLTTADCLGVKRDDALELIARCLPHVDVFMPNEQEACKLTGKADVAAAARRLRALGAACVIVKRGERGCLIVDEHGERVLPAFDAPVVDTTGCGDAFCAAVIVARCARWSIDDAAELGNAAAALTMRGLGSDAGARTVTEALEFMQSAPRALAPAAAGGS